MRPRLASSVLVKALIRAAETQGGTGVVLAKGDPLAGAVAVILAERGVQRRFLERMLEGRAPILASDPATAIEAVGEAPPDLVFIDVSAFGGAALALVHHVKALAPDAAIHALATPEALASAASAVALGGAGVLVLPLEGDEVLTAISDAEALPPLTSTTIG